MEHLRAVFAALIEMRAKRRVEECHDHHEPVACLCSTGRYRDINLQGEKAGQVVHRLGRNGPSLESMYIYLDYFRSSPLFTYQ
jgi:hypothetical protein